MKEPHAALAGITTQHRATPAGVAQDEMVEVAGGVCLRVRRWPGQHGIPVVLVHGLSSNALLWETVAELLADAGHPTYAVDLRSHGESDAPADGHDTQTAAADLAAVCTSLGLAPAVVAGQSWGGNVALRLAARHPGLVAALALVDGGWTDLAAEFPTWEACERALLPPALDGLHADDMRNGLRSRHPDWSARAVEATVSSLRVRPDGRLERRLPIAEHMRIVRSMWDEPPWRDYAAISVPVLLLPAVPNDDPARAARQRAAVEKATTALARSRVEEYVGADHDIHAQHPTELAEDLIALAAEL
jgi:non-heme chloroperoxidase